MSRQDGRRRNDRNPHDAAAGRARALLAEGKSLDEAVLAADGVSARAAAGTAGGIAGSSAAPTTGAEAVQTATAPMMIPNPSCFMASLLFQVGYRCVMVAVATAPLPSLSVSEIALPF